MDELEIFGRTHKYETDYDVKKDIRIIEELRSKVREPQILCYCGGNIINIYIKDDDTFICDDCIHWVYDQNKERLNEQDFRKCLLKCSIEDKEWTEQRNKDLTGIFYRKISFLPEIQDAVCNLLDEYLQILNKKYEYLAAEKQDRQEKIGRQKAEWKLYKIFKDIRPTGGENGRDGYIDAEYISQKGIIIRMVSRDVFDVGCYSYPKRLEGSDDIFNNNLWTTEENQLGLWLSKFGEFHGIRM